MGNSCEFRYVSGWEIRGYLRERSGFAAICVEMEDGCSGFGKDHELARIGTNIPVMSLLHSCELVKFVVINGTVHEWGTLMSSATLSFRYIRVNLRPFAAIRVKRDRQCPQHTTPCG
jgi:hypothetical protein